MSHKRTADDLPTVNLSSKKRKLNNGSGAQNSIVDVDSDCNSEYDDDAESSTGSSCSGSSSGCSIANEDLKQCKVIYKALKTIYTHHPSCILQEIAEYATGIIKTCNNELCQDEVLVLNGNYNSEKSVFCQQCTSRLTRCWYQWEDYYDNTRECGQQFVERKCECGGYVRFCSRHRSSCNKCGDICCTNQYSETYNYTKWKCSAHRSADCMSCKQTFCEAKDGGTNCRGCGYVCKNCIEYKCECNSIESDEDGEEWRENCIIHKNCKNNHVNHLGFCDCSKECSFKVCCCHDINMDDPNDDKVIHFTCLGCGVTKKYNSDHLPKERRFTCIEKWEEHACGHGVCLDCKMNKKGYTTDKIDQKCECGTRCDHW